MHNLQSMIDGIDKELVYKFYAILPLYSFSGKILKKFLIKQLHKKYGLRHRLINFISIPLLDIGYVFNRVAGVLPILRKSKKHIKSKVFENK